MTSDEIENVRYGQIRRGKGFMLFEFRGRTYEAPEPYPWILDPNAGARGAAENEDVSRQSITVRRGAETFREGGKLT